MAELRSVDPRTLKPNPNNPRRTPVPPAMDEQLVASIKAIGIIQPPVVREADGELIVKAGGRRVKAAITAELPTIDVLVKNDDDDAHGSDGVAVGKPDPGIHDQRRHLARRRGPGETRAGTSRRSPTRSISPCAPSSG